MVKKDTKKQEEKKEEQGEKKDSDARLEDLENQLKRAVADYRNLEKRVQDEKRETAKFANLDLLSRLIPAFDTLFFAAKFTNDEGVKLTAKNLITVLGDVGVEKVKTEGEEFNPEVMEAIEAVDGDENKVTEEVRPGFTLFGKLLRPAHVKVGKGNLKNN